MGKCPALTSMCSVRMVSLRPMFTEKKHLLEFTLTFPVFLPLEHKFRLVYTLLNHCFYLATDIPKFHFEIEKLKEVLLSNGYSNKYIDKCISKFMNKLHIEKPVMLTVPTKQLYFKCYFLWGKCQL